MNMHVYIWVCCKKLEIYNVERGKCQMYKMSMYQYVQSVLLNDLLQVMVIHCKVLGLGT